MEESLAPTKARSGDLPKGSSSSSAVNFLLLGLFIGLFLGGIIGYLYTSIDRPSQKESGTPVLDMEEARARSERYINENLLQPGVSAVVTNISEEKGLYKLDIILVTGQGNQSASAYITADGSFFIPNVINMKDTPSKRPEGNEGAQTPAGADMKALAGDDPSRGPADAPVTIIEYGDFSCGPTAQALHTMEKVLENYPNQVRFVYKNLQTMGGWSTKGMIGAECAYRQDTDAFWNFHDNLFHGRMQGTITTDNIDSELLRWAEEMGLDTEAFRTCYENQEPAQEIANDIAEARSLGITSTPTFIINGRRVAGSQPYEVFRQIIENELGRDVEDTETQIPPVQDAAGSCKNQ